MDRTIRKKFVALSIVTVFMLTQPSSALAESPMSRESLERMFAQIAEKSKWDMSSEMLWGYFFTSDQRQPLGLAAKKLSTSGYRVVDIYLSDKDKPSDPDLWWLHVERIERHSVESLDARNKEHTAFARKSGLKSYDGMDVGPVSGRTK